ncbi:MAG TPA: lactonase family protein [Planctomycetota bacterium]|jgi:6-phosphogluconolactonase
MLHAEDKLRVYIGTYTVAPASVPAVGSQGIYLSELDLATGKLTPPVLAAETGNPSFLALHPSGKFLYAAAEIWAPKKAGAVNAFAVNPATGLLTLLNSQSAQGAGTCHVSISPDGKYALAANYGSGSVCALPIGPDGKLGEATAFIQHAGQMGPNKSRQEGPHAHSINMDAAGKLAFAADLGMDKIFIYKLDPEKGTLTPNDPPYASVAPGSGPRHFAFHPNGRFAYIINEMANTVTAFSYDAQKGALTELQTLGTLPADFTGKSHCAEVVVHPSGKFLYGSNRGHDSIAIFKLDEQTGKLTAAGQQPSGGKNPRNFNVTPDGKWLLAAHQDTNNICVFKIDDKTGALMPTDSSITVSKAVRVLFAKP